jgi:hypothetical protein
MPLPPIDILLRRRRAAAAGPPAGRRSADPVFLAGLNAVAAIEYDANAGGSEPGSRLGVTPDWQPVVGSEAIPCRVVLRKVMPSESEARPGMVTSGRVLFGQSVVADRRNRLVFADGDGATWHLYLTGKVRDAHQMGHHWVADVQDRPL